MSLIVFIGLTVFSYLLGAVPFGLVYSRLRGVDIRKMGSGNIGATNVSRQFGFLGGFVPVFAFDFIKGALPVIIVRIFGVKGLDLDAAMLIAGLFAMIGHIFPIYLGFKGGKGVATAGGVFIAAAPIETGIVLFIFLIVLFTSRIVKIFRDKERKESFFKLLFKNLQSGVALSSIIAAFCLPFSVFFMEPLRIVLLMVTIPAALLLIIKHRSNIIKMIKGEH